MVCQIFFNFQLREVETAPHLENYFSEEEKALYDFLFSSGYRRQCWDTQYAGGGLDPYPYQTGRGVLFAVMKCNLKLLL